MARRRSSFPLPSPNLVRTHPMEHYQALRDSAPSLSRDATLPKGTKLELGRGAHLGAPSSANHTAAASQPIGRIAKAASWLHLSRVSPAPHLPERLSHTHTPKPVSCFGMIWNVLRFYTSNTTLLFRQVEKKAYAELALRCNDVVHSSTNLNQLRTRRRCLTWCARL